MSRLTCTHGQPADPLCLECPPKRRRIVTYRVKGADVAAQVAELKPTGAWIVANARRTRQPVHRVTRAWSVTGLGDTKFGGRTVCRLTFGKVAQLFVEPPDDLDFCDGCLTNEERTFVVYRLYDAVDRLLYVGYTSDLPYRVYKHRRGSEFGALVARTEYDVYPTGWLAEKAEVRAIQTLRPLFNRSHNRHPAARTA